uniref:Sodium/calcium exchanger membrane region domain-containing protein n=1 Tax=Nelumbo nucifera TaxID=4432 RepID=A0A822YDL9_NELNU|nr:TPA_asm: hypothetical protein HUJ06_030614 [Nelumbo nucifera]
MATVVSKSQSRAYLVFLNISFLLLLCFLIRAQFNSSESLVLSGLSNYQNGSGVHSCEQFQKLESYKEKCLYLKANSPCVSQGFLDNLYLFYCVYGRWPVLGYCLLSVWLLVLFYLLGNTASEYFCPSLENLSGALKLSPPMAGVTLLSIGNGAADLFSSLVSFTEIGTSGIGLNSVVGGAFFVSCIVVGVISISMGKRRISVNKSDFLRDASFLLLGVILVLVIVIIGEINLWGAMAFTSLYFLYVFVVYIMHSRRRKNREGSVVVLPMKHDDELGVPILGCSGDREDLQDIHCIEADGSFFSWNSSICFGRFLFILLLPLYLPRRMTIPVVCEERWSKPFAVISLTLAPVLLVAVWSSGNMGSKGSLVSYIIAGVVGISFGVIAFVKTGNYSPPKKCLLPWFAVEFLMSVTWSYIIAEELIGLLVSFGKIFGISLSILGLTVLAWGNSLGDLVTNFTLAVKGGPDGAQIAMSGCYAGPTFNTFIGLGLSLVISSWNAYPASIMIAQDKFFMETIAFLVDVASTWWDVL